MRIPYGVGAYSRQRGNLPPLRLINLFVERSQTNQDQIVLQSRFGISPDGTYGSGPVRGTLQKDGVFNGDRFVVSGDSFYRGSTLLGTINGSGPVYISASDVEVLVTAGQSLYSYNGTDFVAVSFPDGAAVAAIIHTAGYFVALRKGTGAWYFSAVLNGRSWDGLDFATAESEPDQIYDVTEIDGVLFFLGTESIEPWGATGDADLPFSLIQQRNFKQGIIGTGCVVSVDNTFFWVGRDAIVYRNGEVPQAIADDAIVEASKASTTHRLYVLDDERHKFVCLRLDTVTYAYDVTSGQWCEFASYGRSNFRVGPGMGDDSTGTVWAWSDYDDNGAVLERRFMAGMELDQTAIVSNFRVECEVGGTSFLTGQYAEPVLEMRFSDDAGRTWTDWEPESLGAQGDYRRRVEWRALGMFDSPGFLAEGRITDPVSFRLSGVGVNEYLGGRG